MIEEKDYSSVTQRGREEKESCLVNDIEIVSALLQYTNECGGLCEQGIDLYLY